MLNDLLSLGCFVHGWLSWWFSFMGKSSNFDLASQTQLVASLLEGGRYPLAVKSVRLIETHISWVLLAGPFAYKIKKAVDLGFLDFTTIDRRKFFCNEEVRLNRRLAPQIYLDVVPIGGAIDDPVFGLLPAVEYAVRMRRFSLSLQLDALMASGKVRPAHIDSLATVLAHFHKNLPQAPPKSNFGNGPLIRGLALGNFVEFPESLLGTVGRFVVTSLQHATEDEYDACEALIGIRYQQGFVRECHGDLHLGNVVIKGGKAVPFDGIEFDPSLRWIDINCDIAFPFMDMLYFQRSDMAYRFLNAWLEITGDYAGLGVLRFYASYRAAVRAKVNAIRATQLGITARKRVGAQDAFRKYLATACNCLTRTSPALIITHGLPGSGKTTFSQMALERFGAIRVRSDVERKRLFGLAPLERSGSSVKDEIYGEEATTRTYDMLHSIAYGLLTAGYRVIIDAAFLKFEERELFRSLAKNLSASFIIASMHVSEPALKARVEERMRSSKDASEADLNVLQALQVVCQPLDVSELANVITFFNEGKTPFATDDLGWSELEKLLS